MPHLIQILEDIKGTKGQTLSAEEQKELEMLRKQLQKEKEDYKHPDLSFSDCSSDVSVIETVGSKPHCDLKF